MLRKSTQPKVNKYHLTYAPDLICIYKIPLQKEGLAYKSADKEVRATYVVFHSLVPSSDVDIWLHAHRGLNLFYLA